MTTDATACPDPSDIQVHFSRAMDVRRRHWPVHGELLLVHKGEFVLGHDHVFLFSEAAVGARMRKLLGWLLNTACPFDYQLAITPTDALLDHWKRETRRVLQEAEAIGLPGAKTRFDLVWERFIHLEDGGDNNRARRVTNGILAALARATAEPTKRPIGLRLYDSDEEGLLKGLPETLRLAHGRIDVGHDSTDKRANPVFVSKAGGRRSLALLCQSGLIDSEMVRVLGEIESSGLPDGNETTAVDDVLLAYADYALLMPTWLTPLLGGTADKPARVEWNPDPHNCTPFAAVYIASGHCLRTVTSRLHEWPASIENSLADLAKARDCRLLTPEVHDDLLRQLADTPIGTVSKDGKPSLRARLGLTT